jgi:SulP family sulfate permease
VFTDDYRAALPGRQDSVCLDLQQSLPHSPRRAQLRDAGWRFMANGTSILSPQRPPTLTPLPPPEANKHKTGPPAAPTEPLNTLEQAFSPYTTDCTMLEQLASYFEPITVPEGHVLWKQGELADGLYVVGTGVLRATYRFATHTPTIEESMVPGTLAGELSGLAGLARNATVVAERPAVVWRLSTDALRRLEAEQPELARGFTALVLKGVSVFCPFHVVETDRGPAAKLDFDILLSAVAARP